jgi:hypothetical protein
VKSWQPGFVIVYRERLWPSAWIWMAGPALVAVLAIAYGAAYGALLGWAIFVPVAAASLIAIALLSPTIVVSQDGLQVGKAAIPLSSLGPCRELNSAELTLETRRGDATVFLALRTWATRRAVVVEVTDENDPHSSWLISTRHPQSLHAAISGQATKADNPDS